MSDAAKPLVAVVDDDPRVLESLEELLESAGFGTQLFRSATEFLESGAVSASRCVISDIRMPGMNGWELESAISRTRPGLPVILITGDDVESRETQLRQARERQRILFRKPFDSGELLAATRAAVSGQAK